MQILENVEYIIAIELLCAVQAIEFRGSEKLSEGTRRAYATIRKAVPMLIEDRVLNEDIEKIRQMVKKGMIIS
jgi:histidine ammonia-lyase